jgi:hypothetical protein
MAMRPATLIRQRITWKLGALAFLVASGSPSAAISAQQVGACTAFVEPGTVHVTGNEAANVIVIDGTADGVHVTCDGETKTFAGVEEVVVEAGVGDDNVSIDHSNGFLGGLAINVFSQEGGNVVLLVSLPLLPLFELVGLTFVGAPGLDVLQIVAGPVADRFDIAGPEANAVEVQVTDRATGTTLANINGVAIESLSVKGGDGDDEFNVLALPGIALSVFGHGGNDSFLYQILPMIDQDHLYDGGSGHDKVTLVGADADEEYTIHPAPNQEIPDPEIRVIDPVTGQIIADLFVQQTEEIRIVAGAGNDRLEVAWNAASMSGLERLEADLGDGDDTMVANLLPVVIAPRLGHVQKVILDVDAGRGDDQLAFHHSAGSWFDVVFAARLGAGRDRLQAILLPPPDDSLPGPEGTRRLQVDVAAGKEDDVVAVQNGPGGESFEVFVEADLGVGDDLLEALGAIKLSARPGRGFDTARVTRNLLPFVTQFERVEVREEVP